MIPTAAEPICSTQSVEGVCPQYYPITNGHLINSFSFDLEVSTLFIYYSQETTKNFCQFCFGKLPIVEQNKYEFCTSWDLICRIQCINMNCYGCRETLIMSRCRAMDCKGCTEDFL